MEANTPLQLLTDTGHNSPPVSHSPGGKRSTKRSISWTSLVHILAPPIVSTVRPTPKYPNWTADSCRGRNSSQTHPHSPIPFYLLYVFKTWRYSEKKWEHSRGFSAVCDCNELQLTSQCVFDSSSNWNAFSRMYHQCTLKPTWRAVYLLKPIWWSFMLEKFLSKPPFWFKIIFII